MELNEPKKFNITIFNAKMRIDNESYPNVISELKLNIGWDRCRVFDGTDVLQCFKCQGYNHKCHGNHKSKECNKEIVKKCIM